MLLKTLKKLIQLLSRKQKKSLVLVIFITVLCAALEAASVVSLAPFISSIVGGDNSNYTNAEWIRRYLNLESVLFYSIVLVSAYFFKIVFVLMMAWIQSGFIYSAINSVGCDLFKHYTSRPYEYFFSVDVSAVIRNVTTETALLAGVLKSCVLLGTELIVLFTLLLVILLIDYRVALFAIGIFLVLSLSYLYFLKPLLIRWGQERQILEGRRIAYLRYALNFNKDIKIFKKEDFFINEFSAFNLKSTHIGRKQNFSETLPRSIVELLFILFISIAAALFSFSTTLSSQMAPILAVFFGMLLRVMPGISRILGASQRLSFTKASVDVIHQELTIDKGLNPRSTYKTLYEHAEKLRKVYVHGLVFQFSSKSQVLKFPDLTVVAGTPVLISGPSGCGKSTLIDLITGLIKPPEGFGSASFVETKSGKR
ncbi:ABC transporter ATP-binding protein/permease, partial [Planktomarina sp.]|nr:ABC transporter ATP-binding protein/permease [Planktomarina sp.]